MFEQTQAVVMRTMLIATAVVSLLVVPSIAHIETHDNDDNVLLLDGSKWSLHNANGSIAINGKVTVPSNVPDQLFQHGITERDPRFGYEQNATLDLMTSDNFTYSTQVSQ